MQPRGTYTVAVPAETHTNQGPLDRNGVFELIRDQLADILETDPSSITEGASFVEDLEDLRTVRDAVDYVYAKLEAG